MRYISIVGALALGLTSFVAAQTKTISYPCGPGSGKPTLTPNICLNKCWAIYCQAKAYPVHSTGITDKSARVEWAKNDRQEIGAASNKFCIDGNYEIISPSGKKTKIGGGNNLSPDEYPYASVREGGRDSADGTLASMRCVPQDEQAHEGRLTGAQQIGASPAGTAFVLDFLDYKNMKTPGKNFCTFPDDGVGASVCENDGQQWIMGNDGAPIYENYTWDGNSPTPSPKRSFGVVEDGTLRVKVREINGTLVPVEFDS